MGSQLNDKVTKYLEWLESSNHPVLAEMEELAREKEFPIIGPQCGRVLATLTTAINGKRVFEMGSGYGYSTLWFATAVGPGGEVVHTDGDENNTALAKEYMQKAGVLDRCRFLTGDATLLLAGEDGPFDVILIDIDKHSYPLALQLTLKKLRVGGFLIAHNALWSGKAAQESDEPDTKGIRQYNWEVMVSDELLSFIDPTHDGLAISLKVTPELRAQMPFANALLTLRD